MQSANTASTATAPQGSTRLEAFVDATFAFSVTLLVISADRIADSARSPLLAPAIAAGETAICLVLMLAGLLSLLIVLLLPPRPQAWMAALPGSVYFMLSCMGLVDALGRRWACSRGVRVQHVD